MLEAALACTTRGSGHFDALPGLSAKALGNRGKNAQMKQLVRERLQIDPSIALVHDRP